MAPLQLGHAGYSPLILVDGVLIGETAYVRTAHALRRDWRFHVGYGLLKLIILTIIFMSIIFS